MTRPHIIVSRPGALLPLSSRRALRGALVMLAILTVAGRASAQQSITRFQNRFRPATWINAEQGLATGPIQPGWWSADWYTEPVAGTAFIRIRNRFRPRDYINIESGRPVSGPLGDA